jgi:hypothetical protein
VTSLPTWAIWTLGFGSPAITAIIALTGEYISRRGTQELESRSKREEALRNLRWAAELAVSGDGLKATLGLEQLQALRVSQMLSSTEEELIDAALHTAIEGVRQAIKRGPGDVEVVAAASLGTVEGVHIPSEDEDEQAEPDS